MAFSITSLSSISLRSLFYLFLLFLSLLSGLLRLFCLSSCISLLSWLFLIFLLSLLSLLHLTLLVFLRLPLRSLFFITSSFLCSFMIFFRLYGFDLKISRQFVGNFLSISSSQHILGFRVNSDFLKFYLWLLWYPI